MIVDSCRSLPRTAIRGRNDSFGHLATVPTSIMSRRNKNLGDWGEEQAVLFLQRHHFSIIDRNYHTTVGEIDIVARQGDDFYFVEVKTRQKGDLSDSSQITKSKRDKLQKTVKIYCWRKNITDVGLILAGLVVEIDRSNCKLKFNFFILY